MTGSTVSDVLSALLVMINAFKLAIPFSLGLLITNDGFGIANDLNIESAQPTIIDNEKGLLVNFSIIGHEIGNMGFKPSLTVRFGDIQPHTTRMANWKMISSLTGIFSNYSATFTNKNYLGDPKLSVMDSVLYHELMHVVRVDYPTDDGIADFLTGNNKYAFDYLPDKIYLSDNGRNPMLVRVGNVSSLAYLLNSRMQLVANSSWSSWVYFRTDCSPVSSSTLYSVTRSDGRIINAEFNAWFSLINKKVFINIIDYIPLANSSFTYDISLVKGAAARPQFSSSTYFLNVSEDTAQNADLLAVFAATDDPADAVVYSLQPSGEILHFSLDPTTGQLKLASVLDRELSKSYSLIVQAVDHSTVPLTGNAIIVVTVIDVNDNAPVFGYAPSDISVEEKLLLTDVITVVSATDADADINSVVVFSIRDDSGLFNINAATGEIKPSQSLQGHLGTYNLTIVASDLGSPPLDTRLDIKIHVTRNNLYAPLFVNTSYVFSVNETDETAVSVGQLSASDADDTSEQLTYSISEILFSCPYPFPFIIVPISGIIQTILPLDQENCSSYIFTVTVHDNGAPPTGVLSGSVNVTIVINAVNRYDPQFSQPSYEVHIVENTTATLLTLRATDRDTGAEGNITDYKLLQTGDNFRLYSEQSTARLVVVKPLQHDQQEMHDLRVIAIDGGEPQRSGSVNVTVIVDPYIDTSPSFANSSANITVLRSTPVNFVIYSVKAVAHDSNVILTYSMVNSLDQLHISCDPYTGQLSVKKSLIGTNFTMIGISVTVTDGTRSSKIPFQLTVAIVDVNTFPPVFDKHVYNISVNESAQPGTALDLRLTATDRDSLALVYTIVDGDPNKKFAVEPLTGILKVYGALDRESVSQYTLTVVVSDGVAGGTDALNDTATVYITILDTNECSPAFTDGPTVGFRVLEGTAAQHVYQLNVTDCDIGQQINYQLDDANETKFSVDALNGWFNVLVPLYRAVQSQYTIQVVAADNGLPSRKSVIGVVIDVGFPLTTANMATTTGVFNWNSPLSNDTFTNDSLAATSHSSSPAAETTKSTSTASIAAESPATVDKGTTVSHISTAVTVSGGIETQSMTVQHSLPLTTVVGATVAADSNDTQPLTLTANVSVTENPVSTARHTAETTTKSPSATSTAHAMESPATTASDKTMGSSAAIAETRTATTAGSVATIKPPTLSVSSTRQPDVPPTASAIAPVSTAVNGPTATNQVTTASSAAVTTTGKSSSTASTIKATESPATVDNRQAGSLATITGTAKTTTVGHVLTTQSASARVTTVQSRLSTVTAAAISTAVAPVWSSWSKWSECPPGCGYRISNRTRTCVPKNACTTGSSVESISCLAQKCPAPTPGAQEKFQGVSLITTVTYSRQLNDTSKLAEFFTVLDVTINVYCTANSSRTVHCCQRLLNASADSIVNPLWSVSQPMTILISVAAGFPQEKGLTSDVQVLFKQLPSVVRQTCGYKPSNRKRQAEEPQYLDSNLMTEALNSSVKDINERLNDSSAVLSVTSVPAASTPNNVSSTSTTDPFSRDAIIAGTIVGAFVAVTMVFCAFRVIKSSSRSKAVNVAVTRPVTGPGAVWYRPRIPAPIYKYRSTAFNRPY